MLQTNIDAMMKAINAQLASTQQVSHQFQPAEKYDMEKRVTFCKQVLMKFAEITGGNWDNFEITCLQLIQSY